MRQREILTDWTTSVDRCRSPRVYSTDILERVDALCGLFNLTSNHLRDQFGGQLRERAARGFPLDDLDHLPSDGSDLRRSGVGGLLDLVGASLGEGDGEESEEIVVGGLDGDVGFDESLPLAHERTELVGCEVESVEVGQAVLSLHLVHPQLDLAESVVLVLLEIGQGDFEYPSLQRVVGVLQTRRPVDERLSNTIMISVQAVGWVHVSR